MLEKPKTKTSNKGLKTEHHLETTTNPFPKRKDLPVTAAEAVHREFVYIVRPCRSLAMDSLSFITAVDEACLVPGKGARGSNWETSRSRIYRACASDQAKVATRGLPGKGARGSDWGTLRARTYRARAPEVLVGEPRGLGSTAPAHQIKQKWPRPACPATAPEARIR